MTNEPFSSLYVLDAHTLYWYWRVPDRLGVDARAVLHEIELRHAVGLIPLIVIAEFHSLMKKLREQVSVTEILRAIDRAPSLRIESLTRQHLLAFDQLDAIPEMHDRLIAAAALVHQAPLVSRDPVFQGHPLVQAIW